MLNKVLECIFTVANVCSSVSVTPGHYWVTVALLPCISKYQYLEKFTVPTYPHFRLYTSVCNIWRNYNVNEAGKIYVRQGKHREFYLSWNVATTNVVENSRFQLFPHIFLG